MHFPGHPPSRTIDIPKELLVFSRSRHFRENPDFHQKSEICEKIINFAFSHFSAKNHILRKIGPGAPKTPKKGWNCIGFIRPGASGPRGTKNAKSCENRAKYFAFSMKILILCKKLGIYEKSLFCALPKRWYYLSFIGHFSSCT